MIKSKEIRRITRENLKNHWGQAIWVMISAVFIIVVVKTILDMISNPFISTVSAIIVLAPLKFGMYYYQLKLIVKENSYSNLYAMFRNKVIWKAMLVQSIYIIGIIMGLTGIGAIIMGDVFIYQNQNFLQNSALEFIILIISIIAISIPMVIFCYTYSQIIFVVVKNEDLSIRSIYKLSRFIMKGNKWRLFRLQITFVWWGLLAIIPVGFGLIWLIPYYIQAMGVFHSKINNVKILKGYNPTIN